MYQSSEDYLERIYMLKNEITNVRSIDLATDLGYSKPSISRAMKLLKEALLITIDKNGYIHLTDEGLAIATKMYDKHVFLTNLFVSLGVDKKIAESDACKIEHDLSDETYVALKKLTCYIDETK